MAAPSNLRAETGEKAVTADEPAVDVAGLTKRYGRTLALDDLSLSIAPGETFALLGPNGAGKTTLIHILCTILRPDSGSARICGHDVARHPLRARRSLGVIFQEPSLDNKLTVRENLEFHGLVFRVPAAIRRKRIPELLKLVDLEAWSDKLVQSLSAGMKRRVEIARALLHDARVVILDEPTVGLDAQSRQSIWDYLGFLKEQRGFTLIVTTHYIEEVDAADRVCVIDHGKILALDTPERLRAQYATDLVRVTPRDGAAIKAIRQRFPEARIEADGDLSIVGSQGDVMGALLGELSQQIVSVSYNRPSLESVFLSLTGRAIRDQPVGQPSAASRGQKH